MFGGRMKHHFIFLGAFACVALMAMGFCIELLESGRSANSVLLWLIGLILLPLYALTKYLINEQDLKVLQVVKKLDR
jgi:hypothetical protein